MVVAITGASSGIGYETAKAFARRINNLIIIALRWDKLEKLIKEILQDFPSLDVVVWVADLSVTQNVYELYESLQTYPKMLFIK